MIRRRNARTGSIKSLRERKPCRTRDAGRFAVFVKEAKASGTVTREISVTLRVAPPVAIVAAAILLLSSETRVLAFETGRALYEIGAGWVLRGRVD
jgi:hypothetical protein